MKSIWLTEFLTFPAAHRVFFYFFLVPRIIQASYFDLVRKPVRRGLVNPNAGVECRVALCFSAGPELCNARAVRPMLVVVCHVRRQSGSRGHPPAAAIFAPPSLLGGCADGSGGGRRPADAICLWHPSGGDPRGDPWLLSVTSHPPLPTPTNCAAAARPLPRLFGLPIGSSARARRDAAVASGFA